MTTKLRKYLEAHGADVLGVVTDGSGRECFEVVAVYSVGGEAREEIEHVLATRQAVREWLGY